jgi:hypothetical protein
VPNAGCELAPCDISGTPLVADGATEFSKLFAAPVWTLYWVIVWLDGLILIDMAVKHPRSS